ncbi:carbohydrate ABC transporter permease [Paenibacillus sp. TAB 01]|uniref:carbohydrate ABC transporter permease n=1 Tax=Paenibacillus sp. TAB 01 TaxID=3368988 RepID=UPI0037535DBC
MGTLKFRPVLFFYILPAFLVYTAFFVIPFGHTLTYSFFEWDGFNTPKFTGFNNYIEMFHDQVFVNGLWKVLLWAVLAVIFKVGTSLVLANLLRERIFGYNLFRSCFFIPAVISSSALCLMFTLIYDKDIGLVNLFLKTIGLTPLTRSWLSDPHTAFLAVIAVPIFQGIGFFFLIILAALGDIPEDLYEAAEIDGAGAWTIFWKMTLPMLWSVLQGCIILAVTSSLKSFDYIFIMTGGGPGTTTEVPATQMYKTIFSGLQYGYGSSMAVVIFLFCLIISVATKKMQSA